MNVLDHGVGVTFGKRRLTLARHDCALRIEQRSLDQARAGFGAPSCAAVDRSSLPGVSHPGEFPPQP